VAVLADGLNGKPSSEIHKRHDASDFQAQTQDGLAAA
jgi:hypothetical protein